MNFQNLLFNIQTQGPIFWAAASAMALGATLLVVSLITQSRRLFRSPPKFSKLAKISMPMIVHHIIALEYITIRCTDQACL